MRSVGSVNYSYYLRCCWSQTLWDQCTAAELRRNQTSWICVEQSVSKSRFYLQYVVLDVGCSWIETEKTVTVSPQSIRIEDNSERKLQEP